MSPFIVLAIPRSRTAWLAHFLSYRDCFCHHEAALQMRTVEDVKVLFSAPRTGASEPAASYGWRVLKHYFPDLKTVVVRRPYEDVVAAMLRVDTEGVGTYDPAKLAHVMRRGARELDRIAAEPGVLSVDYADLEREDVCAAIFEHCLPYKFDREWWEKLRHVNIQVNVASVLRYYHENKGAVDGFKSACKSEMRRLAYAGLITHNKGA